MTTWRERTVAAEKRGFYTPEEKRMANDINRCAVGEVQQILAPLGISWYYDGPFEFFSPSNVPETAGLYQLAGMFNVHCVAKDDFALAHRCLDRIEDRVLALKREHDTAADRPT